MDPLVPAAFAGALSGLGILALVLALRPARPSLAVTLARLDAPRGPANQSISAAIRAEGLPDWRRKLGARVEAALSARGVTLGQVRSDLSVLGRSMEGFLATTVVLGALGLVLGPTLIAMLLALGAGIGPALPVGIGLICAIGFGAVPFLTLRQEAGVRRRDFRHAVGSFLDLVAMNLAGGRGVPEALVAAAQVGGGWPFARIRDTLAFARLQGLTPWAALGRLGEELKIDELRDLSAALTLVADDGAKVRQSLDRGQGGRAVAVDACRSTGGLPRFSPIFDLSCDLQHLCRGVDDVHGVGHRAESEVAGVGPEEVGMRVFTRLASQTLVVVAVLAAYVHTGLEPLRRRTERGASAVEWAVIAGITVAAAAAIGTVIWNKVNQGNALINTEIPNGGGGGTPP